MSAREWQPGDVAMVTKQDGATLPAVRTRDHKGNQLWVAIGTDHWITDGPSITARPLVVIDPDDLREVGRLEALIDSWAGRVPYSDMREDGDLEPVTALQAALREFANPKPPKPEEPTGLGAVVEDADGVRWVRVEPDAGRGSQILAWRSRVPQAEERVQWWSDIDAVRVLSEGFKP